MIHWRLGTVRSTLRLRQGLMELEVDCEGRVRRALLYDGLTGQAQPGDTVVLNATAVDLGLGSGGSDFVAHVYHRLPEDRPGPGHIVKLRYTPYQLACLASEEPASPHHGDFGAGPVGSELKGIPVVACCLHSQVAPACAAAAAAGRRVAYVHTDGGALPAVFSDSVWALRSEGVIAAVVTAGHAFGGDLEAVGVHSGLIAACRAASAEVVVAGMGPGVVGTGTRWGTTALEQGEIINAAAVLGGEPLAALRLGAGDPRARHQGVSHHCLTSLGRVAMARATVVLPVLASERRRELVTELERAGVLPKHRLVTANGNAGLRLLKDLGIPLRTMGRDEIEAGEFFAAAAAAGAAAAGAAARGRDERG